MFNNKKDDTNFLDLRPSFSQHVSLQTNKDAQAFIEVENTGAFNKIAQVVFKKPRKTNVHLDEFGSFVCKQIDGTRTVLDIANLVHSEFGEEAEPLYPRLIKFMQIMKSYEFIELRQPASTKRE